MSQNKLVKMMMPSATNRIVKKRICRSCNVKATHHFHGQTYGTAADIAANGGKRMKMQTNGRLRQRGGRAV
jgi:hypothetical protein